jgi:hypothetical protein
MVKKTKEHVRLSWDEYFMELAEAASKALGVSMKDLLK